MGTQTGILRTLGGAMVAATATVAVAQFLNRTKPGGAARWERTNHRGETITLVEGPALAVGLASGLAGVTDPRLAAGGVVASLGAGAFGLIDDMGETGNAKGLKGHLGALAHGELTTGGLKILGIGASGLAAAALVTKTKAGRSPVAHLADVAISGALVAGAANLFNLLDLRPGRALKAGLLGAGAIAVAPGAGSNVAGAIVGATTAALADDLDERTMAGDSGANALGAVLGLSAVSALPMAGRITALGGIVALTLASEKVSFTEVIAKTPILRNIDSWGRRP